MQGIQSKIALHRRKTRLKGGGTITQVLWKCMCVNLVTSKFARSCNEERNTASSIVLIIAIKEVILVNMDRLSKIELIINLTYG